MPFSCGGVHQQGNVRRFIPVFILILLAAGAAGYYLWFAGDGKGYAYRGAQTTELHGVVHWEHSNIPATNIELALYRQDQAGEELLLRKPVSGGYYRFEQIPARQRLFVRAYQQQGANQALIYESPLVELREGRARYLPVYLPSRRERRAGGYNDILEGRIEVNGDRLYLSPGQDYRVRLSGVSLNELKQLHAYLVGVKGQYQTRDHFIVGEYYVIEAQTGDRPMLGRLHRRTVNGEARFVLVGEEDIQLLRVPANYRLRPRLERNLGALVLLSGPVEQDAIKPLTLSVVAPGE